MSTADQATSVPGMSPAQMDEIANQCVALFRQEIEDVQREIYRQQAAAPGVRSRAPRANGDDFALLQVLAQQRRYVA